MDKHLNIFHFFQDYDSKYYENNLSRALALCLRYDSIFLDRLLTLLLTDDLYRHTFNTDFPDHQIQIDLQCRLSDLNSFEHLIAVATTPEDIDFPQEISARTTENPITDVAIEINDIIIIFEIKISSENCIQQLENQIDKLKSSSGIADKNIHRKSFSWKKIMSLATNVVSFQKQINQVNPFTNDLVRFIELRHTNWLPTKKLYSIKFPKNLNDLSDPNFKYLNTRLTQLKQQMDLGELVYYNDRIAISVNYGWASELNLIPETFETNDFISLKMWPGDTKGQGINLFRPNKNHEWPQRIADYDFEVSPYLKFSHFNSGIAWLKITLDESKSTHNQDFFKINAGRWKKEQWPEFQNNISNVIPDWRTRTPWTEEIEQSNRTYFDLSLGYTIGVRIPFKKAQQLDRVEITGISNLASELRRTANELKYFIDTNL